MAQGIPNSGFFSTVVSRLLLSPHFDLLVGDHPIRPNSNCSSKKKSTVNSSRKNDRKERKKRLNKMHFPPHFHLPFFLSLCAHTCVWDAVFIAAFFARSLSLRVFCARKQTVRPHHMQFGFEVWCAFFKTSRRELPACFVRLSKSHLLTVFVLQCSVRPPESANKQASRGFRVRLFCCCLSAVDNNSNMVGCRACVCVCAIRTASFFC